MDEPDWVARYNADIRLHLAIRMEIVDSSNLRSRFDRIDYEASMHFRTRWSAGAAQPAVCSIDPLSLRGAEVVEETVWSFVSIGYDDESAVVLHISPVSCRCGKISGATGEWRGSLADLMQSIMGAPEKRKIVL